MHGVQALEYIMRKYKDEHEDQRENKGSVVEHPRGWIGK